MSALVLVAPAPDAFEHVATSEFHQRVRDVSSHTSGLAPKPARERHIWASREDLCAVGLRPCLRCPSGWRAVRVTGLAYAVVMQERDVDEGAVAAGSRIRVMTDGELTPAARAAMQRRTDEELRRLAEQANQRG